MTDVLEVSTTIHAPRSDVYEVVRDVEGYESYSKYVRGVARRGDGGAGTEYGIALAWWKLAYTVRVRVTGLEPPRRLEWQLVEGLDARGDCRLEPADVEDPNVDCATDVTLTARYDPHSADADALSLPRLLPLSTVVERARPVVEREAERVLARVVADLEEEPRRPTLTIRARSGVE